MFKRLRVWRLVCVGAALMLGTLVTAPIVAAAKPDKLVLGTPGPIVNPAGEPCAFQVNFDPINIKRTIFTFEDGTQFVKLNGYGTLSNPASGASFLHHVVMQSVERYDPDANEYLVHTRASSASGCTRATLALRVWSKRLGSSCESQDGPNRRSTGIRSYRRRSRTPAASSTSAQFWLSKRAVVRMCGGHWCPQGDSNP